MKIQWSKLYSFIYKPKYDRVFLTDHANIIQVYYCYEVYIYSHT